MAHQNPSTAIELTNEISKAGLQRFNFSSLSPNNYFLEINTHSGKCQIHNMHTSRYEKLWITRKIRIYADKLSEKHAINWQP